MLGEVTIYQWTVLALGIVGFLVTWTGTVITVTRTVGRMKEDTSEKIDEETSKITDRLDNVIQKFEEDQRTQDQKLVSETQAIRDHIQRIELFGRDNYVLKRDFLDALQKVETTLVRETGEIKSDIRELVKQLGTLNSNHRRAGT